MQQILKEPFSHARKEKPRCGSRAIAAASHEDPVFANAADADALILNYRIALEAAKCGHADAALIPRLFTMVLPTRFLTEAGHGLLERAALEEGESVLVEIADRGAET
jgi:hypothetical protein